MSNIFLHFVFWSLPFQMVTEEVSCSYLAPEYFLHGKVIDKIDVYAYGVVLLELLSGRKPIDNGHPKGPESLVTWVSYVLMMKIGTL